ncbi:MAG: stage II sporulation protein M, partial [archaeon]
SSFWKIVPHGIFELPAIFVSLGLGIKLGAFVFGPERKKEFVRRALASLKVFVYVVLPLLIIAAIIEGMLIFLYK